MSRDITRVSRRLSWLLRHGAGEVGLPMDAAGWAPVPAVLAELRIDRPTLEETVRRNTKRRLQLEGERVRCCQGHSLDGMPVTLDGLEATWRLFEGAGPVWHGSYLRAAEGIAAEGLRPAARTHVHLAPTLDSVVGKRASVHFFVGVDPAAVRAAGVEVFEAPNGVVLCRAVPREALCALVTVSRRARAAEGDLRVAFGLEPGQGSVPTVR